MKDYEPTSTSTARLKPVKNAPKPLCIYVEDLEAIREIEQAQKRERVELYQS